MPEPIITFAFILATLLGALFHLIVGGDARRLAIFLFAGWAGFLLGHVLGISLGIDWLMIGELRMFSATIGALFTLFVAYIFTSTRSQGRTTR